MTDSATNHYKASDKNNPADGKVDDYQPIRRSAAAPEVAPDGRGRQGPGRQGPGRHASPSGALPGQASALGRLATSTTVRRQHRVWSRRVNSWDHHTPSGLEKVTAAVLAAVSLRPGDQVVDLGCGTGQLSLPLAERGARVLAVDVSPAMIQRLGENARERRLIEVDGLAMPIESLSLPEGSVDLIVTSYALHHLRDADKDRLVSAAFHWLRPGGMLVVADMMFGRGGTSQDRAIIKSKVSALAKKGIGGYWRIAKNAFRYMFRMHERPVSITAWTAMFRNAGFTGITSSSIVAEAGLVAGQRPAPRGAGYSTPPPSWP